MSVSTKSQAPMQHSCRTTTVEPIGSGLSFGTLRNLSDPRLSDHPNTVRYYETFEDVAGLHEEVCF